MAENAANFTHTSANKPSVFEIIAQKSLNDTLHPALQKVALFLDNLNHEKFYFLTKYYEESFLVFSGLLQLHYINSYDASFSESFYGLQRKLINGEKLKTEDKLLSLVFLVLLPYLKRKLEERLTIYRVQNADGSLTKDLKGRFKKFLIFVHSCLEICSSGWTLHTFLQYMCNQSESQLPSLKLIDLKLEYQNEPLEEVSFWSAVFKGQLRFSILSFGLIRSAVTGVLETVAFFLQFLQVWNSQMSNYSISSLPKVEPPSMNFNTVGYKGKCPICLQTWKIPTVLPASGFIFCFKCILNYLRNSDQKCPVTNIPAQPKDVVILYES